MTSKIVNFPEVGMMMVITRLTDYTVKHLSGLANVPHLCVKVRHNNGFAWFGLSIVSITDTRGWSRKTTDAIRDRFMDAMGQIIDLAEMDSDLDLLMGNIQSICTARKRPVMFGANSNEFIQISSTNNVQIELYRNEVKHESTTYGGYFMVVEYEDQSFPVMVYHRGVILYNYIDVDAARELARQELLFHFPEMFRNPSALDIPTSEVLIVPRNRNKLARIK